jgi:hypothetical protein
MVRFFGSAATLALVALTGCDDGCKQRIEDCFDRGSCPKTVDVALGSPPSETYFRCEYPASGDSPCRVLDAGIPLGPTRSVAAAYSSDGTRFRVIFGPRAWWGERYHLDAPRNLFSGDRGRFCREAVTDLVGDACHGPHAWVEECALSGTMTLATDGSGHIVAHFEDHTVEASWRP